MNPGEVLACRSNLWGLVRVAPYLELSYQQKYLDHLLSMIAKNMDIDTIFKAVYAIVLHNKRQHRLDIILHIAKRLENKGERLDLRILVLDSLHTAMALILEDERARVMEAMLSALLHDERVLIEKVLGCFSMAIQSLPSSQRYVYCMMIMPLAHEASFQNQVHNILAENLNFLQNEKEKETIQKFLTQKEKPSANPQLDDHLEPAFVDEKIFN